MKPTISICIFTHNDLEMLRATLMHQVKWADQICILDMASNDGTQEFCETWLRPCDVYQRRAVNTCPTLGFGEARTAAAALATCDWIFSTDADNLLDTISARTIHRELENAKAEVCSVWTYDVPNTMHWRPHQIEAAVFHHLLREDRTSHRGFIRRGCGIDFKGYIHEEAFRGEVNCFAESEQLSVRRYHFTGWMHNDERLMRYYWMFNRALENPELQKYTHRWWYDVFCVEHSIEIKRLASEYELKISNDRSAYKQNRPNET